MGNKRQIKQWKSNCDGMWLAWWYCGRNNGLQFKTHRGEEEIKNCILNNHFKNKNNKKKGE